MTLEIDGMSCGHCVTAVERALRNVPGVTVSAVQIGLATVNYDPALADADVLLDAVADAGYGASVGAGGNTG